MSRSAFSAPPPFKLPYASLWFLYFKFLRFLCVQMWCLCIYVFLELFLWLFFPLFQSGSPGKGSVPSLCGKLCRVALPGRALTIYLHSHKLPHVPPPQLPSCGSVHGPCKKPKLWRKETPNPISVLLGVATTTQVHTFILKYLRHISVACGIKARSFHMLSRLSSTQQQHPLA